MDIDNRTPIISFFLTWDPVILMLVAALLLNHVNGCQGQKALSVVLLSSMITSLIDASLIPKHIAIITN